MGVFIFVVVAVVVVAVVVAGMGLTRGRPPSAEVPGRTEPDEPRSTLAAEEPAPGQKARPGESV